MKGRYCNMRLKKLKEENDPWPPVKTKSYVTLALVHQKELQTTQETMTSIYLRMKEEIPQKSCTKGLTDLTQIFDSVSDTVPNSILIEGHAGIGKTTLVKEICTEWAEGTLLTSDKLVLLLLLRDPQVQKITDERGLIEHFTKSTNKVEQLCSYLEDKHGIGVTLIIDGFDELSTELRRESFFGELIEKNSLPKAKIVVTSRPSASACLHGVVDKRIEILGFEQSSKNQYITEALQDSPSKLDKLKRHFRQYPNIDAICYIPLMMSIIVFLCMCQPDDLPPTVTKIYSSFIHTICHYLKRARKVPEDEIISKLEQFPPAVHKALKALEKTAFNGLVKDKIIFTVKELPVLCKDDPTCYGILQSSECYSAEEIGIPTQSFNFLHLGMQEYFAAKYVTTLPDNKVYTLLKQSFITEEDSDSDSLSVRLSNMWILYCGITSGKCKTLRHHLTTYGKSHGSVSTFLTESYFGATTSAQQVNSKTDSQVTSRRITGPYHQGVSSGKISNTGAFSQEILNDHVNVLYLFQCFHEAQDNILCELLSESFHDGVIDISEYKLLRHQVVSLGFFLSRSRKKWKEFNLQNCDIEDHDMSILHHYLCGVKGNIQEIAKIDLSGNCLTEESSHLIADIISHLHPHTLCLYNNITNVKHISTVIITTSTLKVLNIQHNRLTAQDAVALSDMMICLENLDVSSNNLGDRGARNLSKGILNTKTLRVLNISNNNIRLWGISAISNALSNNTSVEELYMYDNPIGQRGTKALGKAIINNNKLKKLSLCDDDGISRYPRNKDLAIILINSLYGHSTLSEVCLDIKLRRERANLITREAKKVNSTRRKCNKHIIDFHLFFYDYRSEDGCGTYTTKKGLSWEP